MYYIKVRDEGTIIVPDYEGKILLDKWTNRELPQVIQIKDLSFLSRNILSIKTQNSDQEKQPRDMSDDELKQGMQKFWAAYQTAKKIPLADYSKNTQIYPYSSPYIAHTFVCEGVAVRQDDGDYFVTMIEGKDGATVILPFLDLNKSFQCYIELKHRGEEKGDTSKKFEILQKKKQEMFGKS